MTQTNFLEQLIARWKSKTPYFSKVAARILFIVAFAAAGASYLLQTEPEIFEGILSAKDLATIKVVLIAVSAVTGKQAIAAKLKVENESAFEALQALQAKTKAQQTIAAADAAIVLAQSKIAEQAKVTAAAIAPAVEALKEEPEPAMITVKIEKPTDPNLINTAL
jgi:hypothetical protein